MRLRYLPQFKALGLGCRALRVSIRVGLWVLEGLVTSASG